jgi:hypothetical protein
MNPYIIKETPTGKQEMATQFPDPNRRSFFEPGSPANPIVIKKNVMGDTEIHSTFPLSNFDRRFDR